MILDSLHNLWQVAKDTKYEKDYHLIEKEFAKLNETEITYDYICNQLDNHRQEFFEDLENYYKSFKDIGTYLKDKAMQEYNIDQNVGLSDLEKYGKVD